MSSNSCSNTVSGSNSDMEHFSNFEGLPFHNQFPSGFFHSSPLHTAFLQLPLDQHLPIPSHHYRHTSDSSSHSSSLTESSSSTTSSLPPLVPNSDISDQLISNFSTLNLAEPPQYTPSLEEAPEYVAPVNNALILRRIWALQGESSYILRQIRELRHNTISQLPADVEEQIEEHLARHQASIAYLEGLLTA